MSSSSLGAVGLIGLVGLCGGVVALGTISASEVESEVASGNVDQEVLRSMTAACPELFDGRDRRAVVTMSSVPGIAGQDEPGSLSLHSADGEAPLAELSQPGTSTSTGDFGSDASHALASGLGGLAPGALVARSSVDDSGEGRGLASARCAEPSSNVWLLGGGAVLGQRDRIVLINPTDSDAVVDLEIFGPDGKIEANGTDSIAVKPRDRSELRLDALAEGVAVTAVHARTRVGLVSGYIVDDRMEELTPRGTEIISAAESANLRPVVTGIPAGAGIRELVLFAPKGKGTAQVRAFAAEGPVDLGEAGQISIRRNRVARVDLSGPIGGRAVSLEITADVPLLATVGMQTRESAADAAGRTAAIAAAEAELKAAKSAAARADATQKVSEVKASNVDTGSDVAWFAAGSHLSQQGAATGVLPTTKSKVTVSAAGGEVQALVSLLDAQAPEAGLVPVKEVTISSDTSQEITVKAPSKSPYTVVVERIGGPGRLYASHYQRGADKAITGYPLARLSPWVTVPQTDAVFGPME